MAVKHLTKKLYCETLLDLCETKDLSQITVTELVKVAGTARQTFYNHFIDINDVVCFIPITFMSTQETMIEDPRTTISAYTYAREHRGFFCQLPRHTGQNNFRDTFISYITRYLEESCYEEGLSEDEELYRRLSINQYVTGTTDLFLDWCEAGLTWPIEVMVRVHTEAMPPFLRERVLLEQ